MLYQLSYEGAKSFLVENIKLSKPNKDLYFRSEDNLIEANHILNVSFRYYDFPFRHCAANPDYDKGFELELDKNIGELLK